MLQPSDFPTLQMGRLRLVLGGLKSFLPLPERAYTGTGGTDEARYCYTVWLRHLSSLQRVGVTLPFDRVVELGPGDSIGVGLAALLTGADHYVGLDALPHANVSRSLEILEGLISLFNRRSRLPGDDVFPGVYPKLDSYEYPAVLLSDSTMRSGSSTERLTAIREAVATMNTTTDQDAIVRYSGSWHSSSVVASGSADLVVGQGVLQDMDDQHADDLLSRGFATMRDWLRPGGTMTHQIELACPGMEHWNGHWAMSPLEWRLVRGRRPYFKNGAPMSRYLKLAADAGFEVLMVQPVRDDSGLQRNGVATRYKRLPDEDYRTRAMYMIAKRPL